MTISSELAPLTLIQTTLTQQTMDQQEPHMTAPTIVLAQMSTISGQTMPTTITTLEPIINLMGSNLHTRSQS